MRQHIAHPTSLAFLRRLLACCLLLTSVALPLPVFSFSQEAIDCQQDTDGDGIGNNADTDDDGDGVPDYIDASPLDAAINTEKLLPLDSGYKGGVIRESQIVH